MSNAYFTGPGRVHDTDVMPKYTDATVQEWMDKTPNQWAANRRTQQIIRAIKALAFVIAGMFVLTAPVGSDNVGITMIVGLCLTAPGLYMFLTKSK